MRFAEILLIVLVSGVVFVNGWTDAPNAIVGIVSTKTMPYRSAVWLAACCNLAGLFVMSAINSSVADTVVSLVDFGGSDARKSFAAIIAAMAAIIVFAATAWRFGIPTSESHALAAALAGSSAALGGKFAAEAWTKVISGLVISLVLGFAFGLILTKAFCQPLKRASDRSVDTIQIFSAGGMAFMHGAQDGQKFAAVFVISDLLIKNKQYVGKVDLKEHLLVFLFCGAVMALGTSVGGKRIIDNVGGKMVSLNKRQSVTADAASGLCLLLASLTGIPMSTTHTKTAAIMGACVPNKKHPVNYKIASGMFLAWIITFPVCIALGYIFTYAAAALMQQHYM